MKRRSIHVLTAAVIAAMSVGATAQIKTVLLEQHTAAWCGWCPDGSVVVDQIVARYGDRVTAVKIHSGDAMEIPEQRIIGNALGLTGFPTASVDRKGFGGSVFLNRGVWKTTCESQMQQRAKAEVDCFYTLNRSTRTVRIRVVANITESMNYPLRFNAYIVENDVTGTGSGYDQANYLSHRSGYEGHPYYDEPAIIAGYHHMSVVRRMLGGAWGTPGGLPSSVQAGELYEYEFESQIDSQWNMDNLFFVGILQANAEDNKEIVNCAVAVENGALLNRIVNSDAPTTRVLPAGSDLANTYTLENATTAQQTYAVTLSTTERTPADWSAVLTCGATTLTASGANAATGQIVVPANSAVELALTLQIGATLGIGDAAVLLRLQGTPTVERSRVLTGITTEIEHVLVETGSDYSMVPYITRPAYSDTVILEPSDYLALANDLPNVKVVIWNKGPSDSLSPEEVQAIKRPGNVNHFICGDAVVYGLANPNHLSYFGLEYIGWNLEARGWTYSIWVSGQQGDVITGSLGEHIEGQLINCYIDMVRITDPANVFPILHFEEDGLRRCDGSIYYIPAEEAIFGVRSTRNNRRTVLLAICPYVIVRQDTREALVGKILDWLEAPSGQAAGAATSPAFEDFETADFLRLPWQHAGNRSWTISSTEAYSGNYSAQAGAIGHGQNSALSVTLTCVAGDVSFWAKVSSESRYDKLSFLIDGVQAREWSGQQDWVSVSIPVEAGTHVFEWRYTKDDSISQGQDTAWIDDIAFPL